MLDFDWDASNRSHIALHSVTAAEAEYVLENPTLDLDYQDEHEEERFAEVGATKNERILVVVTTWRGLKTRVVTAFDAPTSLVYEYLKTRGIH